MPDAVALPPWLLALLAMGSAVGVWKFLAGLLRSGARADLEKALAEKFATLEELNGLGAKVTGLQKVADLANEMAEEALATAERLGDRVAYMEKEILPRLDKMTDRLTEQGEALAAQTAALRTFMDEYRSKR